MFRATAIDAAWSWTMTIRKTMLMAALFSGLAAPAMAQEAGGVVGGATVRMLGGGDDATMVIEEATRFQPRRLAQPSWGNGSGIAVRYLEPAPVAPGRHMTMIGGGDDAQLVAAAPSAATPAQGLAAEGQRRPRG
jgi:hypothetical protein